MARWAVYAEYGGECFEAEVSNPDLKTKKQAVADVLEFIKISVTKVDED